MLEITPTLSINESEIKIDPIRSSGPGGQNVNKVATAVQLRFDIRNTASLPEEIKERLIKIGGHRVTDDGEIIIIARRYRSQDQNRFDAIDRLITLILKAVENPKARKATKPSEAAKEARLNDKKKRGETKRIRRSTPGEFE